MNRQSIPGRISIIIPAYNAERYIAETIESVLRQDYPDKEIIVVDDGSTDGTPALLQRYGGSITVVRQENAGVAAARNRGLAQASGEFIAFLDADDVWLPGKLSRQVAYLRAHPDVGMVYGRWICWHPDADGGFRVPPVQEPEGDVGAIAEHSGWIYDQLLLAIRVHTITALLRAAVVARVGRFDESLPCGEDYDYWLRASRVTEMHKLDADLALYRLHAHNMTKRPAATNYEALVLERAIARWGVTGPNGARPPRGKLRERRAQLWFDFGYAHFHAGGDMGAAGAAFARVVRCRPLWIKGWAYIVLSGLKWIAQSLRRPAAGPVVVR